MSAVMSDHTRAPLMDRVLDKIIFDDGCWEWAASHNSQGYGKIREGGAGSKVRDAHRVVYELLVGPIPPGLVIDHLCRNPGCVRPDHLEAVTQSVNVKRGERW